MEEAFPPIVNEQLYKFFGAALAEARFDAGRVTDALALVDHALNTGEGPASGLYVPEIHRLRGVFLKSLGSPAEEVERALRTALQIAEEQGAFLLKLRAAMSLARLWRDQGKVQRSARTARSGLRVVHRRVRHARSEGGEGAFRATRHMSEVRKWLDAIGLAQYADAFETNDLDMDLLGQVDDQLLKDIGVSSAGHRLRIRNAIAKLSQQDKSVSNLGVATDAASATAERRQVTVMFSDLVGSTALSARMDPEDLREVISAYQKCVAETVQRFGGFVAKYMGDGVLVYFGYPQAHEDDAERAVRAGLELIAAVGALKTHAPLQTRVGIATGLVVVGDLIGSGASQEQAIVGETPNLAARLQGIAEPNSVVIAESTRKLVGNLFELERPRGTRTSRALPGRCGLGRRCDRVQSRAASMRCTQRPDRAGRPRRGARAAAAPLVEGKERRRPGGAALRRAGHRQVAPDRRAARAPRQTSRTRGCAISARRTIRTARFIRSSRSSNAPPGSRATTRSKRSSANCGRCSRQARSMTTISHC